MQTTERTIEQFSVHAEQSVIGAMLMDNDSIDRMGDLKAEHFYNGDNRIIFTEIVKQIAAGKQCDVITVGIAIGERMTDCLPYLNSMAQNTPSSASIGRYAAIVRDRAIKRSLVALGNEVADMAAGSVEDAMVLVDRASSKLEKLAEARVVQEPVRAIDEMGEHIEELERRREGTGAKAISTGFDDLDKRLSGGLRRGELIVVAARPKMGKAQPVSSKVLLSSGRWIAMGDIAVGDSIASVDGTPSIVTDVFPQGVKQTYQITFSDGRSTRSCAEHLWRIGNRKWVNDRVIDLAEISMLLENPSYKGRLYIPLVSGDFGGTSQLPLDPYALGALLGNGDFASSIRFSTNDPETLANLKSACPGINIVHAGNYDYRLVTPRGQSNWLLDVIRELGLGGTVSNNKFIPEQYLRAGKNSRVALLQGLMDTDGWVEKSGTCIYATASEQLADDIEILARSLGCVVRRAVKAPTFTYKGERKNGLPSYVLKIASTDRDSLFRLDRKIQRCGGKIPRLNIESIEPTGIEECVCIAVSHPSRLYITDDYIVTHNTAFSLNVANNIAMEHSVLVLSMEMPKAQIHDRNLASLGHISLTNLLQPTQMTDSEWSGLTLAIQKLSDMNLFLDDQGGLRLIDVRMKAKQTKRRHGLDAMVVDYLQLMEGDGDNRNAQIEGITRGLKALAKELDIAIILLSQLNRELEKRPNKRPQPSDLRDSGAIEQDADAVIFLYRDEVYNPDTMDKGICEVDVALCRQGAPGRVALVYIGEQTRFENAFRWAPQAPKTPTRRGAAEHL